MSKLLCGSFSGAVIHGHHEDLGLSASSGFGCTFSCTCNSNCLLLDYCFVGSVFLAGDFGVNLVAFFAGDAIVYIIAQVYGFHLGGFGSGMDAS